MTAKSKLLATSVLTLLISIAAQASRNGDAVPAGEWPQVGLMNPEKFGGQCTATLIADDVIITANHCNRKANRVKFETNPPQEATTVEVRVLSKDLNQEVALMKLNKKITGITPIAIEPIELQVDQPALNVGYGLNTIAPGISKNSGQVLFGKYLKFEGELAGNNGLNDKAPMAGFSPGPKNQLPCQGDSGGSVFVQKPDGSYVISAINSFVSLPKDDNPIDLKGKCEKGWAVLAVSVFHNWDWINQTLEELRNMEIGLNLHEFTRESAATPGDGRIPIGPVRIFDVASKSNPNMTFKNMTSSITNPDNFISQERAQTICSERNFGGMTGWRLPSKAEGETLAKGYADLEKVAAVGAETRIWTREKVLSAAWFVDLKNDIVSTKPTYESLSAICVR